MAVVVTSIGIVSALGIGAEANLRALRKGQTGIRTVSHVPTAHRLPCGELDMTNDALRQHLGIDRHETISRTALLGIAAAREALTDIDDRSDVALVSSTTVGGMDLTPLFYEQFMSDPSKGRLRYVAGHDCASTLAAIQRHCGLAGYATSVSTACSSTANAMIVGSRLIEQGLAKRVLVGGTDALSLFTLNGFRSLMILSDEPCRPFSADRKGLNLGEGAAYVMLEDSSCARRKPLARLTGYANANDAHHQTALTPEGRGPEAAMRQALERAGLQPSDISYINVHGTATQNNDSSEGAAMRAIWGEAMPAFGSTKGFTGHTLAAAGAIEAVFSIWAIEHGQIWGNAGFGAVMPDFGCEPVRELREAEVEHVMSNSFGFGGNCSSLIFSRP